MMVDLERGRHLVNQIYKVSSVFALDDNLVVHFIKHIHSDGVVSTHLQHPVVAGGDGETWRINQS